MQFPSMPAKSERERERESQNSFNNFQHTHSVAEYSCIQVIVSFEMMITRTYTVHTTLPAICCCLLHCFPLLLYSSSERGNQCPFRSVVLQVCRWIRTYNWWHIRSHCIGTHRLTVFFYLSKNHTNALRRDQHKKNFTRILKKENDLFRCLFLYRGWFFGRIMFFGELVDNSNGNNRQSVSDVFFLPFYFFRFFFLFNQRLEFLLQSKAFLFFSDFLLSMLRSSNEMDTYSNYNFGLKQ